MQKIKGNLRVDGSLNLNGRTGQRALTTDGSGNLTESSVTTTELGRLSGVTGDLQTQIDAKIASSEKGANSGVATLDSGGKIPASQLPNTVMEFQGTYDATTNSPALVDGTGNAGDVYLVSVAGTQNMGSGSQTFAAGDWVVYNGSIWQKSINSNSVASVNGQQGVVVLDSDDVAEGATNLYFTDERAQDAIGNSLADTSSVDMQYNDATGAVSAVVLPAGVDHNSLQNFSANKHVDHTAVSISAGAGLTGGGDISASRSLAVDITGTTAETVIAAGDEILIQDVSAGALRKMTRSNFLAGIPLGTIGDINSTSFSGANNQTVMADVTGFAFANASVKGFKAFVNVQVDATSDLFETFELLGVQKAAGWELAISSTGDDSQVVMDITSAGQIQYTSGNYAGFVSLTITFRAFAI